MHLNGWQRIGIVLSALWATGLAAYFVYQEVRLYNAMVARKQDSCHDFFYRSKDFDLTTCLYSSTHWAGVENNWAAVIFLYILAPIIGAWLLTLIAPPAIDSMQST